MKDVTLVIPAVDLGSRLPDLRPLRARRPEAVFGPASLSVVAGDFGLWSRDMVEQSGADAGEAGRPRGHEVTQPRARSERAEQPRQSTSFIPHPRATRRPHYLGPCAPCVSLNAARLLQHKRGSASISHHPACGRSSAMHALLDDDLPCRYSEPRNRPRGTEYLKAHERNNLEKYPESMASRTPGACSSCALCPHG